MEIIGEAYRELQDLVKLYAKENLPVLFIGETGTGKELFMSLYMKENKRTGKKLTINCAALSDDLLRSEVFGHAKGAFTGAETKRAGKIETCKDGILALDEIGDATTQFQAAILRICEANTYSSLGSDEEKTTNTLIIAATNKPENLRQDLRERFHILPIPPLQKEDIPALAEHILGKPLTDEVIEELTSREYRGNIRELKKVCDRLKVRRGEKIFSLKSHNVFLYHFDYYRFEREMNTWKIYVQPLIDFYGKEHGFEKYRYQYMPWDGDSLEWILNRDEYVYPYNPEKLSASDEDTIRNSSDVYTYICCLKRSINEENDFPSSNMEEGAAMEMIPEDYMESFKKQIRYIFDCSILPCLLGYTYLKAEMRTVDTAKVTQTPNLTHLLDLPLKQAEKEFVKHYYDYNVKKHSDTKKLEDVVGMSKKSLDQKFRRNE